MEMENAHGRLEHPFSLTGKKVWVAGHTGLVGDALMQALARENCERLSIEKQHLDLRNQTATRNWMFENRPDVIILAAATVGGIGANAARPAEFIYDNLLIQGNIIHNAYEIGVQKLLFLGSSCIYPKEAHQPILEEALLTGPLETTNKPYALAKIAGIEMCQAYRKQYGCDFIAAMPCNLYGPGDRFDPENSHVIPALMMRMHEAKRMRAPEFTIWGTGKPLREFLYIHDLTEALILLLKHYSHQDIINIGANDEISIAQLAETLASVIGYEGKLIYDHSKPDGTLRKRMNSGKMQALGWSPSTALYDGLKKTYQWYCENYAAKQAA